MTDPSKAFHGFAVPDTAAARAFYADVLGIEVTEENDLLFLQLGGGTRRSSIRSPTTCRRRTRCSTSRRRHRGRRRRLTAKGVEFERYEGTPIATDEKGIFRGEGR